MKQYKYEARDRRLMSIYRGNSSARPYQDFRLWPTRRKMARSSVGSLLLVVAFTIIITAYAEAQLLRRIMGDDKFCEQKFDKCMHERTRMTRKGCEKRTDAKYGCHFHKGVHHPHSENHKESSKSQHHPPNHSHHPRSENHKESPKSQHHPQNDSHHPRPENHKVSSKSQHHPHDDSHHPRSEDHKEHPKSQHH